MSIIITQETSIANDTRYTLVLKLNGVPQAELGPGNGTLIREFNSIELKDLGQQLLQNPNENVEIGRQSPDNYISLKSQSEMSITFSYSATETEVKTIRFGPTWCVPT